MAVHSSAPLISPGSLFARVFYASPVAMAITVPADGTYVDANQAFADLVGVSRAALLDPARTDLRLARLLGSAPAGALPDDETAEREAWLTTAGGDFKHVIVSTQTEVWEGRNYVFTLLQDLSNFDHTETALQASEARWRLVFESVPLPVFVYDRETLRFVDVNQAVLDTYGYSRDEMLAMTMLDIRPPEEQAKFLDLMPNLSTDVRTYGVWKHWKRDGTPIDMEVTGYGTEIDGRELRMAVCRDITEQMAVHEALRRSEERHRIIANVTNDVLWDSDPDSDLINFSDGLLPVFGYRSKELTTMKWWAGKIHPDERDAVWKAMQDALGGDASSWMSQYRFQKADGQFAHVLDRGYIFRGADGRATRFMGAMIDITDQVEAQEAAALAALEERRRLARDLHDAVTQSLYSLSLMAEAARRHARGGDWNMTGDYIRRLGELAQQSLKEMRLLVYEMRPSVLEKEGLAGALQARLDAVERHSGIRARLMVELDEELTPATQLQYYRVAVEALNNALKHSGATAVRVLIRSTGDAVLLEVSDNGRGFEPGRAAASGGLGLVSMRERLEKLGGEFELETAPGKGTTVRVTLKHMGGNHG